MIIVSALRASGPIRVAGVLVSIGLLGEVLGLPAGLSLLVYGLLGIGLVWLGWLARKPGQPRR
jgi:hypothetical protein